MNTSTQQIVSNLHDAYRRKAKFECMSFTAKLGDDRVLSDERAYMRASIIQMYDERIKNLKAVLNEQLKNELGGEGSDV